MNNTKTPQSGQTPDKQQDANRQGYKDDAKNPSTGGASNPSKSNPTNR